MKQPARLLTSILAMTGIGVAFCGQAAAQTGGYNTVAVTVESAGQMTTIGATVVPYKEVTLAAQIAGQVKFVGGREGDQVKAGKVLVSINDDAIQARRRSAMAQWVAAEAELRNAHVQYSRELWSPQSGKPTGMGMPSMMDSFMRPFSGQYAGPNNPQVRRYADLHGQAKNLDSARSRLLQARALIEQLDAKIRDAHLSAPFDGVITAKLVEKGDTVQPGQPLLKVAYVKYLRIQAEVPVGLVSSLRRGDKVSARIDVGGGIDVEARVSQIFPVADRSRHTVTVKFDLRQGVEGGPGMYAEVHIPDLSAQATKLPTVPKEAIINRGSLRAVKILSNGRPSLRLVRVGGDVGGGKVAILSGLVGGEQVIMPAAGKSGTVQAGTAGAPVQ